MTEVSNNYFPQFPHDFLPEVSVVKILTYHNEYLVAANALIMILYFSAKSFKIMLLHLHILLFIFSSLPCTGTNYWRNRVLKVAKDYKDKLNFAIASKTEFGREMESFGNREKDEDVLVAVKNYAGSKFLMPDKFRYSC